MHSTFLCQEASDIATHLCHGPALGLLPRHLVALTLLLAAGEHKWFQLLFPAWVLLVSVVILVVRPQPVQESPAARSDENPDHNMSGNLPLHRSRPEARIDSWSITRTSLRWA
jgi:hypothetical protein